MPNACLPLPLPLPLQIDNTYNKLQTLCEYIDDTEVGGRVCCVHAGGIVLRAPAVRGWCIAHGAPAQQQHIATPHTYIDA